MKSKYETNEVSFMLSKIVIDKLREENLINDDEYKTAINNLIKKYSPCASELLLDK